MNKEDYNEYYIQNSNHYLIPKDVFMELFNEMINWKEENKILRENAENNDKVVDNVNWENMLLKKENKQIKEIFNYRKRWKQQKNRNKRLTKKINKIESSIAEDLKLDITNDEIRKLKKQVNDLKNQVKKLNLEAQKYFEMLIEKSDKQ